MAVIEGEKTLIERAKAFDLHPNRIRRLFDPLLVGATGVFGDVLKAQPEPVIEVKNSSRQDRRADAGERFPFGALGGAVHLWLFTVAHARIRESIAQENDRSRIEAQRLPLGHRFEYQPERCRLQAALCRTPT